LFGQLDRILWISDSEAGVKVEKTGGVAEEGRCGEVVVGLLARDRRSLDILSVKRGKRWHVLQQQLPLAFGACLFHATASAGRTC